MQQYRVAVAVENDPSCHKAIQWAIDLCKQMSRGSESKQPNYKLYFVYAVAQNPTSRLPIVDRMDKAFNLEIHEEAKRDIKEILQHLDSVASEVDYEFVKLEKQADVNTLISEFCQSYKPDVFAVGAHRAGRVKKMILGSVSQYCVDNLPCPVVVAKSD